MTCYVQEVGLYTQTPDVTTRTIYEVHVDHPTVQMLTMASYGVIASRTRRLTMHHLGHAQDEYHGCHHDHPGSNVCI